MGTNRGAERSMVARQNSSVTVDRPQPGFFPAPRECRHISARDLVPVLEWLHGLYEPRLPGFFARSVLQSHARLCVRLLLGHREVH